MSIMDGNGDNVFYDGDGHGDWEIKNYINTKA